VFEDATAFSGAVFDGLPFDSNTDCCTIGLGCASGSDVNSPNWRDGGGGIWVSLGSDPDGLGLGVGIEVLDEVELSDVDFATLWAGEGALIRSAAIRTLAGTRFNLMAPPAELEPTDGDVSLGWGLGALNGEDVDSTVHGDGSGLSGDIIDAEVDRDGRWALEIDVRDPLVIGILRPSPEGFRNSLGRL
jgi:hypothetical protein